MSTVIQRREPQKADGAWENWQGHALLKRIYLARGVNTPESLEMGLEKLLDYSSLSQMDKATALIHEVMKKPGKIIIVGDFDTDGATSSALVMGIMRAFGHDRISYLVPNRFEYGYGLTPEIVELAYEQKPDLIITVDNGIANHKGVERANQYNIPVIVTDHHLPAATLPEAAAIINPNVESDPFPSKALAGVGVAFYLMLALRAYLKDQNWFNDQQLAIPNLSQWLDLVAVGTVADMVPLDENNRRLVYQGLKRIRVRHCRPGILALLELAKRDIGKASSMDIGFAIGPRLNAAGRLDDMSIGIQCLLSEDPQHARALAVELDQLNLTRREIETSMQQEAMSMVDECIRQLQDQTQIPDAFSLFHDNWHQGVVGLVASRVKEKYYRPVIAFARENEDPNCQVLKGSARSIPGIHIRDALVYVDTMYPGLMKKFGGHAMAAGLSLSLENFKTFEEAFRQAVRFQLGGEAIQDIRYSDGELEPKWMNLTTCELLQEAGPWGQHFPEPSFDGVFDVVKQSIVGVRHLKLIVQNDQGKYLDAIAFNIDPEKWKNPLTKVKLLYRLNINEFRGERNLQLVVEFIEALS